jgi:hypothetical protein
MDNEHFEEVIYKPLTKQKVIGTINVVTASGKVLKKPIREITIGIFNKQTDDLIAEINYRIHHFAKQV